MSSGVARCEAPSRGFHGETSMTLRLGDGPVGATAAFRGAVTNSATHTYYTQPYPVSLDPDSAGSQGGARITVHGTGFMDVDTLACKVGTIGSYFGDVSRRELHHVRHARADGLRRAATRKSARTRWRFP